MKGKAAPETIELPIPERTAAVVMRRCRPLVEASFRRINLDMLGGNPMDLRGLILSVYTQGLEDGETLRAMRASEGNANG